MHYVLYIYILHLQFYFKIQHISLYGGRGSSLPKYSPDLSDINVIILILKCMHLYVSLINTWYYI